MFTSVPHIYSTCGILFNQRTRLNANWSLSWRIVFWTQSMHAHVNPTTRLIYEVVRAPGFCWHYYKTYHYKRLIIATLNRTSSDCGYYCWIIIRLIVLVRRYPLATTAYSWWGIRLRVQIGEPYMHLQILWIYIFMLLLQNKILF